MGVYLQSVLKGPVCDFSIVGAGTFFMQGTASPIKITTFCRETEVLEFVKNRFCDGLKVEFDHIMLNK